MIQYCYRKFFAFLFVAAMLAPCFSYAGIYEEIIDAVDRNDAARVNVLLPRGVDPNTSDAAGDTLLMMSARKGYCHILEILLANKASVLKINKYGDSALMYTALYGHLDAMKILVAAGADTDPEGWTPLIYAALNGHVDILRYLLDQDIDIDAQSPNGTTALMAASRNGHLKAVKFLLEKEADPDLATQGGKTALDLAQAGGNSEIVKLLRKETDLSLEPGQVGEK